MGFEFICAKCGKKFVRDTRYRNTHLKYYNKTYCSQDCQRFDQELKVEVDCLNCGEKFKKSLHEVRNTLNNFCSSKCTAIYFNARRKKILYKCKCGNEFLGTIGLGQSRAKCDACKQLEYEEKKRKLIIKRKILVDKICVKCGTEIKVPFRTTLCKPCRTLIQQEVSHRNGIKQQTNRRSKNEMLFAELCKQHLSNVLENPKMFDGWDADVVIPSIKVAVAWNGPWHYKDKIRRNHSLKQIQNRDKLKAKSITKHGYSLYIIKDTSHGFNSEFVKSEFDKFYELHKP